MARNGSGTYSLPAGQPVVTGTTISSTTFNTLTSDLATAITQSISYDGQTTPVANLPMGGYKLTGLGAGTANTDAAQLQQVQSGAVSWLSTVAGTDTITAGVSPTPSAYAAGQVFRFVSAGANTGAATINVSSLGAKSIKKNGTTALSAGDIASGQVITVVYDGTNFQLVGVANPAALTDVTSINGGPLAGLRNKIIGGDFTTNPWQRGTSFAAINGACADRFQFNQGTDGVATALKTADAPTAAEAGVYTQHCLHIDVTTADAAIGASQYATLYHAIEGYNAASFGFGQAGTRYVTLSFWHKHTKAGVYCVAFVNSAANRSYVAEYTQDTTDTWEKATITVPVDTSGTWLYDNGAGIKLFFAAAAGSTLQTSANTWAAGLYFATANQVNALDNVDNNFKIALVQLEAGSVATPFEQRPYGMEFALCQRYLPAYNSSSTACFIAPGLSYAATTAQIIVPHTVKPRVAPSGISVSNVTHFSVVNGSAAGIDCTNLVASQLGNDASTVVATVSSGLTIGQATQLFFNNASGQLLFTGCEL